MAKYKDTYNGSNIQFNSVDTTLSGNNKKWGQAELGGATDADLVDIASDYGGKLPTIVNAVEIDWNAADLGKEVEVKLDGTPSEGNSAEINTICELIYQ